ncbi:MAG TPA: lipoate--protein ligase [Bacteroidales bacterium]|nr:lipoate--protein ligase [Bacteroidales bacterium]
MMYLITSETSDPSLNLALDEFFLKKSNEEFIILCINSTSVISGKHQCVHKEINTGFISENRIPVLRRITGGGTVFHDAGNLNYTFILNSELGKQVDFPKYTKPVLGFLESIGVSPEMHGSDIKVNGRKISGNAEHIHRNRVLHHGTLLYDASLDILRNSLRKDPAGYETKAVASNPSPVMNIRLLKPEITDIHEFRSLMNEYFLQTFPAIQKYEPDARETVEIKDLADKKYRTWEWNYAYGPDYSFSNSIRYKGTEINFRMHVREGIIRDMVLNDGNYHWPAFEKLIGVKHMPEDIAGFLMAEGFNGIDVFGFF